MAQVKIHIRISTQYELSLYVHTTSSRTSELWTFITFITELTGMEPVTPLPLWPYWNDLSSSVNRIFCNFNMFSMNVWIPRAHIYCLHVTWTHNQWWRNSFPHIICVVIVAICETIDVIAQAMTWPGSQLEGTWHSCISKLELVKKTKR